MFIEKFSLIQLTILLFFLNQMNISHGSLRISGGFRSAGLYLAKYIISFRSNTIKEKIYFGSSHYCGGTLISRRYILTAAHCLKSATENTFFVVSGTPNRIYRTEQTQIRKIEKYLVHPKFIAETLKHDIALVKVEIPFYIDYEYTDIANLFKEAPSLECPFITAGWGRLYEKGPTSNEILYANVKAYSFSDCRKKFNIASMLSFCAGGSQKAQAYVGDSGGPLFCQNYVVGVVSFGYAEITGISVYTNISYYKNWIEENSDILIDYDVNIKNSGVEMDAVNFVYTKNHIINCELTIIFILLLHKLVTLILTSFTSS